MDPENVSKRMRISRNIDLPSIPTVLVKILEVVDRDRASARVLEELILRDPAISARLLRLANSAFYSFRSEVKTISHAIALLGLNLVKSIAIGVSIFESFSRGLRNEAASINQLWMHSFGVGLIAQEIWVPRANRTEGEFALLCGLLHDIGKAIFFQQDTRRYGQIFASDKKEGDLDMSGHEVAAYGMSHASLGAILAKQWGLPAELTTVIEQHHDPLNSSMPLVAAISLSDALTRDKEIGFDGDMKTISNVENLVARLNMDPKELDALMALADERRQGIESFFARSRPAQHREPISPEVQQ